MSSRAATRLRLDCGEALELLRRPDLPELASALTGSGLFAIELARAPRALAAERLAEAQTALACLPCPSIALVDGEMTPATAALARHCDLVLDDDTDFEHIAARIERHPRAALAFVQLLRHGARLDLEGALIAESWVYSLLQSGPEFEHWFAQQRARPAASAPTRPAIRIERDSDRLLLRLDRPERHNAFSAEMRDALCEALDLALADPTLREIELSGEGPSFSSGGDLAEFGTRPDPATAHVIRSTRSPARRMAALSERLCVEVHGACVGAGAELPAFARRVVARRDAWFQLPELDFGLVPGAGGSVSLPRRIGRQRTAWLVLSGERLGAERALAWGLVDALR